MRAFLVRPKKTIRTHHFVLTPDMEVQVQSAINGSSPTLNEIASRYQARYGIDIRNEAINISDFTYKIEK